MEKSLFTIILYYITREAAKRNCLRRRRASIQLYIIYKCFVLLVTTDRYLHVQQTSFVNFRKAQKEDWKNRITDGNSSR